MKTLIAIAAVSLQLICMVSGGWAQGYTRIVSPVQNQTVPGPDVKVQFEAGGMTLGPNAWNLHFKLDDEPFQVQFDGNHAHVFRNVKPGSHTVRVYAADGLHRAIAGTQSTVSFHVAYADGANFVNPGQPTLTYNLPQGEYLGVDAADVTVDFLLDNATISPGGYQVAYYADGRRFLVQNRCTAQHLKNLAPGPHRIRMELQDANGDLVPGPFNSAEKIIVVSPDSTEKSPWPIPDGYEGQPRIDSIPGAMTAGGPRPVIQRVTPLSAEEISKQLSLTVNKGGETVRLNGQAAAPVAVTGEASATGKSAVSASGTGEFKVREGGLPEEASVNLDSASASSTAKKGTIQVNPAVDPDDDLSESVTPVKTLDDEADVDNVTSGSIKVRRRADGSTSKMETTPTLRLADKPEMRQAQAETTRTVVGKDTKSSATANKPTPKAAEPATTATAKSVKTPVAKSSENSTATAASVAPAASSATAASTPAERPNRDAEGNRRRDRGSRSGNEANPRNGERSSRSGNRAERSGDRRSGDSPAETPAPQAP